MKQKDSYEELLLKHEAVCGRLEEAEETLRAIRNHEVDALITGGPAGDQVYTLQGAEHPYHVLVETMSAGAATVTPEGIILYSNGQLAEMLGTSLNKILGRSFQNFIVPQSGQTLEALLFSRDRAGRRGEFLLKASDGEEVPVLLSARPLLQEGVEVFCIIATDLTEQRRVQRALEETNTALKVLLKRWEEDRRELEERLVSNVKRLVLPHVEKLKNARLEPSLCTIVDLIEANLEEILSPFLDNLRAFNLTSRQLEIIALIKDGRTTKDIAEVLHVSKEAIDKQRFLIRKKLDLNKEKANLRFYLLSLA